MSFFSSQIPRHKLLGAVLFVSTSTVRSASFSAFVKPACAPSAARALYHKQQFQIKRTMAGKSCCPTDVKPAVNDYQAKGSSVEIAGHFDMYVAKEDAAADSKKAIVVVNDIFGVTPNSKQFTDALSTSLKSVVVLPNFLGEAWPIDNIPPTKEGKFPPGVEPGDGVEVLYGWIMGHPSCRTDRAESIEAVKEYLKKEFPSVEKFGMVGMCWGAKVCWVAGGKGIIDAVAGCHPSLLGKDDAEACNVPMCMLNSKDEPEEYTTEMKPILESKPFADKNVFKTYETMHHGWMGTRGIGATNDFTQDEQVAKFQEGIADLTNFFEKAL